MNQEAKSIAERIFDLACQLAKIENKELIQKEMMETIEADIKKYPYPYSSADEVGQMIEDIAEWYLGR